MIGHWAVYSLDPLQLNSKGLLGGWKVSHILRYLLLTLLNDAFSNALRVVRGDN